MPLQTDLTIDAPTGVQQTNEGDTYQWDGALAQIKGDHSAKLRVPIRLVQPAAPRWPWPDMIIFLWLDPAAPLPEVIRHADHNYLRNTSIHHDKAVAVYERAQTHDHSNGTPP